MTEHTLSQDHHPTLRHPERQAIGAALQSALVVLTDLALAGKHAHWNITGPHFLALHRQLDQLVDAWREAADSVAERAVALGRPGGPPGGGGPPTAWPSARSRSAIRSTVAPASWPSAANCRSWATAR